MKNQKVNYENSNLNDIANSFIKSFVPVKIRIRK